VQRKGVTREVYGELIATAQSAGDSELESQLTAALEFEINPPKGASLPKELAPAKAKADPMMNGRLSRLAGITSMMINLGAFFGMFGFGTVSQKIGRKPTFAIAFIAAFASTAVVFGYMSEFSQLFWMVPIMGFCQLSLFAGYAMYFPELFPTHLRSTGTSFCYNVGRFIAATGPLIGAKLIKMFAGSEE
jgi:MFS family permease